MSKIGKAKTLLKNKKSLKFSLKNTKTGTFLFRKYQIWNILKWRLKGLTQRDLKRLNLGWRDLKDLNPPRISKK